ncbi:bifunctional 2-polyprenyl-6-hydroxyphenol methylase/3-demethylubiquinol 3-O-methyltransferase UbiG [Marmoricola sp. URHB0036]|uniref:class I SAM-dependent methyltransferase n=1 Tax=Marmoricola sp. URHB0036 TaxID=1298863 RepID=UPI0004243B52|nr:class I SAM-dependent methyltransferase [Marmoricola sp. URHB0036]
MDAAAWDERYAATALVWSAGPNQFVESELASLPPGRALDLACGEGRNARWLAERGWQVTAIDWSQVAVDKGRQVNNAVDWRVGDALTAPLPAELDLVVLAYFQVAADTRRTAIRRSFDALSPGGTLFVIAHDSTNLTEGTGGPQDAAVLYTAADVLDDLAEVDLEVVRAERVARVVDAGTAWDALVRVVRR